jgi:hypothetical protein
MSAKQTKGKTSDNRDGRKSGGQREARIRNRGKHAIAEWGAADKELIGRLVCAIARDGRTVQFGIYGEGQSYSLRVYGDGDTFNEYLPATGDVDLWLTDFAEDYENDGTRPEYSDAT